MFSSSSLYHPKYTLEAYQPRVVAYYFKQWDGFRMAYHTHRAVEIMYVISGRCLVEVQNGAGREDASEEQAFAMRKGEFILIDADVPHRLTVEEQEPCRMLNIEFVWEVRQGAALSLGELAEESGAVQALLRMQRPCLLLSDSNEVYAALKSLVLELDEARAGSPLMIQLLLAQLLLRTAQLAAEAAERAPQQGDVHVRKTIAYMRHHYDCDIQVKDIAEALSLHPGYLHRLFKAHTGSSLLEYLTALRMEKARMLLARTDIPVGDIPDYIGMNSRPYFSAVFKKHTGQTPAAYRRSVDKAMWNTEESEDVEVGGVLRAVNWSS